mmetsp:Transcript_25352/g.27704  ORF Transcript_25352/g.27704 Transcript_25352/m.27704 type:complete len:387 (+) Transcript_25352:3-1163(+)
MAFNPELCNFTIEDMANPLNRKKGNCICGQPAQIHPRAAIATSQKGIPSLSSSREMALDSSSIDSSRLSMAIYFLYAGTKADRDSTTQNIINHDLEPRGTAFFINPRFAVAARHCCYDESGQTRFPVFWLSSGVDGNTLYLNFPVELVFEDTENDIAVLKVIGEKSYTGQFFTIASIHEVPSLALGGVFVRAVWASVQLALNSSEERPITVDFQEKKKVLHYCRGRATQTSESKAQVVVEHIDYRDVQSDIAKDEQYNLVVVDGGLSGGSCGSPYVFPHNFHVLAMHLASNNEGDLNIKSLIDLAVRISTNRVERKRKMASRSGPRKAASVDDVKEAKNEEDELTEATDFTEAYFSVKEGVILSKCAAFVKWMKDELTVVLNPDLI